MDAMRRIARLSGNRDARSMTSQYEGGGSGGGGSSYGVVFAGAAVADPAGFAAGRRGFGAGATGAFGSELAFVVIDALAGATGAADASAAADAVGAVAVAAEGVAGGGGAVTVAVAFAVTDGAGGAGVAFVDAR
jgi:hypothetical protein